MFIIQGKQGHIRCWSLPWINVSFGIFRNVSRELFKVAINLQQLQKKCWKRNIYQIQNANVFKQTISGFLHIH